MLAGFFAQGTVAYAVLGLGLAALATGLLSFALARSRTMTALGIVSLALTIGASTVALVAVTGGRARLEIAARELPAPEQGEARRKGYAETREGSAVAVGLTAPALALGGAGLVLSILARRKRAAERGAEAPGVPLGAIVVGGVAVFTVIATAMPLIMGMPGERIADDDPSHGFARAEASFAEGRAEEGCAVLDEAFRAGAKAERGHHVDALVSACFEQKLAKALAAPSLEDRKRDLGWLAASKLPLSEPQQRRLDDETRRTNELEARP